VNPSWLILGAVLLVGCEGSLLTGAGQQPENVIVVITDPEDKVIAPVANPDLVGIQDIEGNDSSHDGNNISSEGISDNQTPQ